MDHDNPRQQDRHNSASSNCIYRRFRGVQVPIIVVGCKLDRLDSAENPSGSALPEEHLESLLEFRDVERCLVCSSRTLVQARAIILQRRSEK